VTVTNFRDRSQYLVVPDILTGLSTSILDSEATFSLAG
jgi:hypothetical protein